MEKKSGIVVLLVLALVCVGFVYAADVITKTKLYPTTGQITSVDFVLLSVHDGNPVTELKIGQIPPGTPVHFYYDLKNVGTVTEAASMTNDLNPLDGTLTWDSEGIILDPGQVMRVIFTITMTLPEGSNFNFQTTITGTET